jgi:phosphoglycolate phosphatase-like HAD superfamily hydrolase
MKLVMFDIDGTLTETQEIDATCFVQALRDVFGFTDVNTDWSTYRHCSDSAILDELFELRRGRSPLPEEISACQARFVSLLTHAAAIHPFKPIEGARDILARLMNDPRFAISLASGGWECSARLKLASAGLDLASVPAAFSDDGHAREEIMQASLGRAARAYSIESFDAVIYIGDGLWDARASRNLGYRFHGISQEPAKVLLLYKEGASHVFGDYLDQDTFMAALG